MKQIDDKNSLRLQLASIPVVIMRKKMYFRKTTIVLVVSYIAITIQNHLKGKTVLSVVDVLYS